MDNIKLTFEGKSYELTYTRETIKQMENTGFDIQMLAHQPTVQGDKMFAGAFLAKCKGVKRKVIAKTQKVTGRSTELRCTSRRGVKSRMRTMSAPTVAAQRMA